MTNDHAGVALRWVPRRYRLIVNIGIINGAVAIDGNGRIGALFLGNRAGYGECVPSSPPVGAEYATLQTVALINRQPGCSIWRNMDVSVKAAAGSAWNACTLAIIGQRRWPETGAEGITTIAGSRADNIL